MKDLTTYDGFLSESALVIQLNEATKVDNIKDLEKQLPKVYDVLEYLKAFKRYGSQFSGLDLYDEIRKLGSEIPLEKLIMSKGGHWAYEKMRTEQGYGGWYNKKADADEAYDKMLDETPERLFHMVVDNLGEEKALKRFATLIIKNAGKLEAAKRVAYSSYSNAGDGYDRHLIMDKFFKGRMTELWHDGEDVYYIKGVGSITTAMRTKRGSILKDYLNDIGKDMMDKYRKNVRY